MNAMTDSKQPNRRGSQAQSAPSGWAIGWAYFAGCILIMVGIFQLIAGLVAIVNSSFYVAVNSWLFQFDATAWGWIHLVLGVVLVLAGYGIFTGNVVARTVGVIVAILSAVAGFMWLPYYPFWAVVIIALDVAVVWALTVHGRDASAI